MGAIVLNRSITQNVDFIEKVSAESGQPVQKCYQCGKCTAGCPVAFAMDLTPNQVIRMVQFGMKEEVLRCRSIWLCATCETCATRCPRNVNLTRVMETLRIMSDKKGLAPPGKARNVDLFYDAFMDTVEKYGRMFEFETMLLYNLKTRQPFRDAGTGLGMFKKGKLSFIPSRVKGSVEIARIFTNVRRMEGGEK
jgi:heterodisulfide reductase subunit C